MKHYYRAGHFMKGLVPILSVVLMMLYLPNDLFAQSVKRQVISSLGSSGNAPGATIMQTVGQSYGTSSNDATKSVVLQGFQQPVLYMPGKKDSLTLQNVNIQVFPIPATNQFSIESDESIGKVNVTITDITGTVIYTTSLSDIIAHNIDCSEWSSGMYFITITDENQQSKTSKLMITK